MQYLQEFLILFKIIFLILSVPQSSLFQGTAIYDFPFNLTESLALTHLPGCSEKKKTKENKRVAECIIIRKKRILEEKYKVQEEELKG